MQVYKAHRLEDSISLMRRAVMEGIKDPKTRELIMCVIRSCEARDDLCEVNAWFEFLKANVKYVADPRTIDLFSTLERTLQMGAEDCDGFSIALATGLESIGFETSFRVIQSRGSPSWNHVYAVVHLPKRRPTGKLPLDLTLANTRPGLQPPPHMIVKFKDFPAVLER